MADSCDRPLIIMEGESFGKGNTQQIMCFVYSLYFALLFLYIYFLVDKKKKKKKAASVVRYGFGGSRWPSSYMGYSLFPIPSKPYTLFLVTGYP